MNFLVCIKQVPDDEAKIHLGTDGKPDTSGAAKIVNAFDRYAVEMAVRYTEANGGTVTVATIGEEAEVRPAVVQMISVGAGSGYIAHNPVVDGDENTIAGELGEMVAEIEKTAGQKFDVILCGKESTDKISSLVAGMLSEKLGVGYVSNVVDLKPADNGIEAVEETEEGTVTYKVQTPALFSVGKPAYEPRYPNLKSKMKARKAVIPVLQDLKAEEAATEVEGYSEPQARSGGIKIQEDDPETAVDKALSLLAERKVL